MEIELYPRQDAKTVRCRAAILRLDNRKKIQETIILPL
jgi:hypothetical protein